MNLVAHHAIGFGLALGLLASVGWVARHTSIKSASFASVGALVLLLFAGIASALGHSEESFSAVLLLSRTVLLHLPLYLVGVGIAFLALPAIHEVPGPLLDDAGTIAFPGFPAEDLYDYRLYALGTQVVIWVTLGLVFGALMQRLLEKKEPQSLNA